MTVWPADQPMARPTMPWSHEHDRIGWLQDQGHTSVTKIDGATAVPRPPASSAPARTQELVLTGLRCVPMPWAHAATLTAMAGRPLLILDNTVENTSEQEGQMVCRECKRCP